MTLIDHMEELDSLMSDLDVVVYGKQCNFCQGIDENWIMVCYNRDECKNITLWQVCEWYLERLRDVDQSDVDYFSESVGKFFAYVAKLAATGWKIGYTK